MTKLEHFGKYTTLADLNEAVSDGELIIDWVALVTSDHSVHYSSSHIIPSGDTTPTPTPEPEPTPTPTGYASQYFTIRSRADDNTVAYTTTLTSNTIYMSVDSGATWVSDSVTIDSGDTVWLKSTDPRQCKITTTGPFDVEGNIMSLDRGDNFRDHQYLGLNGKFSHLLENSKVVDASNLVLIATDLSKYEQYGTIFDTPRTSCYDSMFAGCTGLTSAPQLPATTLAQYCYMYMFSGCTSLTSAPQLPATTLANQCYCGMFYGCTGLTSAPQLQATTLAADCYGHMFSGCISLTSAPQLPGTTLAEGCYESMFDGCSSLTTAPALPATTLANRCYMAMFSGCTSLTTAPQLPATTLADKCYRTMFQRCSSLTTAPQLPATTLAADCYGHMFEDCTSLTTAPQLPATTLANQCYEYMFEGCSNITSITCLATNISANNSTSIWVYGVAATGTFTKSGEMDDWTTGISGIPNGWTVVDYIEI